MRGVSEWKRVVSVIALMLYGVVSANAQDYPNRPVKVVVGFPPGGGVDTAARVIGHGMSQDLRQPMIIENKPGATGVLGASEVARSAPDGYTILVTPGTHAIFGAMFKSLPFDTVKSFDWISSIVSVPLFVVVGANSEFKSLSDIVSKAKASPGEVTFGSPGVGAAHHLGVELFGIKTGAKFIHVPYRGEAAMVAGLIAGDTQFGVATATLILEHIKAGKLRALAVTTQDRSSKLPDAPTVGQALGITNYDVSSWFALAGPAGMPPAVVARLSASLKAAIAMPDVQARLTSIGELAPTTPQQMRDKVARELEVWTETVRAARIEQQ